MGARTPGFGIWAVGIYLGFGFWVFVRNTAKLDMSALGRAACTLATRADLGNSADKFAPA